MRPEYSYDRSLDAERGAPLQYNDMLNKHKGYSQEIACAFFVFSDHQRFHEKIKP